MKPLSENRRARFDYDMLETYEAGVELSGQEVKSIKAGRANLTGSYAVLRDGELWLLNAQVPAYQPKNAPPDYDPTRSRRLLLHRNEIMNLTGKLKQKGLSLLPLSLYLKHSLIKVSFGLGRSRKTHDKREVLKKRTAEREMQRDKE